jgi:hypothetical protein
MGRRRIGIGKPPLVAVGARLVGQPMLVDDVTARWALGRVHEARVAGRLAILAVSNVLGPSPSRQAEYIVVGAAQKGPPWLEKFHHKWGEPAVGERDA